MNAVEEKEGEKGGKEEQRATNGSGKHFPMDAKTQKGRVDGWGGQKASTGRD